VTGARGWRSGGGGRRPSVGGRVVAAAGVHRKQQIGLHLLQPRLHERTRQHLERWPIDLRHDRGWQVALEKNRRVLRLREHILKKRIVRIPYTLDVLFGFFHGAR
jgi:hypothetical protein